MSVCGVCGVCVVCSFVWRVCGMCCGTLAEVPVSTVLLREVGLGVGWEGHRWARKAPTKVWGGS